MRNHIYIPSVIGLLVGVTLLVPTCLNQRFSKVAANRVIVRLVRSYEQPSQSDGIVVKPGDFVLESSTMRVVVGGLKRPARQRGAVIEAMLRNGPLYEAIGLLSSRLQVSGGNYPIVVRDMYATWMGNQPVLRMKGLTWVGKRSIEVVEELTLNTEISVLIRYSRTISRDDKPVSDIRVGARIVWGRATPFVPGTGTLEDGDWHQGDFIGNSTNATSTLYGFHDSQLRVAANVETLCKSLYMSHTDVIPLNRAPRVSREYAEKSYLIIARGGLAQAVRRLGWARGKPFREVLAVLPYSPEGSKVTIYDREKSPYIYEYPKANGQAIVPLPIYKGQKLDKEYSAVATAYGHGRSDPMPIPEEPGIRVRLEIPKGGRIRIRARDTESGRLMISRVRVIGIGGTASPDLGPRHRASGAENVALTVQGEVTLPAEPGDYRVLVSHGPEWSLHDENVLVTETYRPDVQADLTRLIRTRDWIACELHVHAAPSSDCQVPLEDRVASLVAEGIRFAIPTDHNRVTDYSPALEAMEIEDFGTVSGVEVTSWDPEFGHFNVFPYPRNPSLPDDGAPPYQKSSPEELFSYIRAIDPEIAIQVNHPRLEPARIAYFDNVGYDPVTGESTGPYSRNYDLLEIWNGYDLARPFFFQRVFFEWMAMLARGNRYVATGGSDSHYISYHWAGYPRTYVWVKGGDPKDGHAVIESLKKGRAMVTNGPILEATVNGLGPGEIAIVRPGRILVRVQVQAPQWMDVSLIEVYANAKKVLEREITSEDTDRDAQQIVRFDGELDIPIKKEGFIIIMIKGAEPMTDFFGIPNVFPAAFINPIWIKFERVSKDT
ncbi:MAG: PHP domain-containing protein [Deltaproteobacteria bacterium]|nr:PHP domain-containing protein [Deltaproteobacteria bacterium]